MNSDVYPEYHFSSKRETKEGITCYVRSGYAPLKACLIRNPSEGWMPSGETWLSSFVMKEID